ncbi:ribosome small subunit-dependent GTPase A [uncultured Tenacibaculum sp.]|uniref:ribosome small subunit-dependent GTPase A n=1 Tax=uncultured Tenacibaculum sp. TaxID=174713 RepID=UPI002609DF1A|nr:ribosome small subunit-dependent GTPase A [uncultured Tenacibaculum sp.]
MYTKNKIGRVIEKHYNNYKVQVDSIVKNAKLKGKLFKEANNIFPCVGDWVEVSEHDEILVIENVLKRKTQISRKLPGNATKEQVIASNVDYVVVVLGLDGGRNYSDRLLERLMTVAWNSGATPLVVLNKADLNNQAEFVKLQAETIAPGVDIIISSIKDNIGIDTILEYLTKEKVGVFIGPSGVGKSTLTNILLKKEVQRTRATKLKDKRGRHTTSASYMFELESGGFIIDSPGIREVQAWAEKENLDDVFSEISSIANNCRYRDCKHEGEPGCAVQMELERGYITPQRYDSFLHLRKELAYLERRKSEKNGFTEKQHGKKFSKMVKQEMNKKKTYHNYINN